MEDSERVRTALEMLIRESQKHADDGEFYEVMAAALKNLPSSTAALEHVLGSARAALALNLGKDAAREQTPYRCHFCGKPRESVRVIVVSGESAICDECAVAAVEQAGRMNGRCLLAAAASVLRAFGERMTGWLRA